MTDQRPAPGLILQRLLQTANPAAHQVSKAISVLTVEHVGIKILKILVMGSTNGRYYLEYRTSSGPLPDEREAFEEKSYKPQARKKATSPKPQA